MKSNVNHKIESQLRVGSFREDEKEYLLEHSQCTWVAELLTELESDEDISKEQKGTLRVELSIAKKPMALYGDYIVIKGLVTGSYQTPCVRCLVPTTQEVRSEIASCFLNNCFEKDEELQDSLTLFADNSELDLHFHVKGQIDLIVFLREAIYMNVDPYPLHEPDCKGLCAECGSNRNLVECGH